MPRGKRLTEQQVGAVMALHGEGKSNRSIAKQLGCSEKAIRTCLLRQTRPRTLQKVGRKSKVTKRMLRRMFRLATIKHYTSKRISKALDFVIKPSTIRKWLNSTKLTKYIKRKPCPALKPHHKKARAQFCAEWLSRSNEWRSVVFSDEKKFNLNGPDGYQFYWHDLRKEQEVYSKRVSGGGSVMIWAGMSFAGRSVANG
ncbi:hypothetical protein LEN26_007520 [Aphanomyces euteiches]|nr:hypothetical protein LEN26_007520 [Aphanomyces euteiches]